MWDGFNTELRSHTHYGVELQNQLNNLEMNLSEINIYLKDYIAIKAVQRVYGNVNGYVYTTLWKNSSCHLWIYILICLLGDQGG